MKLEELEQRPQIPTPPPGAEIDWSFVAGAAFGVLLWGLALIALSNALQQSH